MITQASNGTYQFERGGVLWAGWPTKEAAAEAAYDLEHGKMPTMPHHQQPGTLVDAALAYTDDEEDDDEEDERPAPGLIAIRVSPGVFPPDCYRETHTLTLTPTITAADDGYLIRATTPPASRARFSEKAWAKMLAKDPPLPIREAVRLYKRGLVVIDTATDVYMLSEAEFEAQIKTTNRAYARRIACQMEEELLKAKNNAAHMALGAVMGRCTEAEYQRGKVDGAKELLAELGVADWLDQQMERPAIQVERHESWVDFEVGKLCVGVYLEDDGKTGVELNIDGTAINELVEDIWTVADLRQLHTALGTLLDDPRFVKAVQEASQC
jgi:hypothetical protein